MSKANTFSVIEHFNGYSVRHNASGKTHGLSDGVDVFDDLNPGEPGFAERWTEVLNAEENEVYEAYFPDIIHDYEVVDHGIEHSQYFQGCGTSFTHYDNVVTGIGDDFAEAFEDCLEQMAQQYSDVDYEATEKLMLQESGEAVWPTEPSVTEHVKEFVEDENDEEAADDYMEDCELHYHVSIRYNLSESLVRQAEAAEAKCPKCGESRYSDCHGLYRCESCDPPCPCCYDGGGPTYGE